MIQHKQPIVKKVARAAKSPVNKGGSTVMVWLIKQSKKARRRKSVLRWKELEEETREEKRRILFNLSTNVLACQEGFC